MKITNISSESKIPTLIFCEVADDQIMNVMAVLRFEVVSRLEMNFFKSELVGVSMSDNQLQELTYILGCKASSLSATYLGLPLCLGAAANPCGTR